jgi:hypothetical protein
VVAANESIAPYGDQSDRGGLMSPEDHPGIEEIMGWNCPEPCPISMRSEESAVREWKVAQLSRLGLSRHVAALFADTVDWHQVEDLLRLGCPLGLALDITR